MAAFPPSYWLKWARAKQHLEEVERLCAPYNVIRPYTVSHGIERNHQGYTHRLFAAEKPDPTIAVVYGDFLFDLRSALDHVRAALVPETRRKKGYFPILTKDPWKIDPATGQPEQATKGTRDLWKDSVHGMPPDAITEIANMQPFRLPNQPADHYALAILQRLNNADKHQELTTVVHQLRDVEYRIDGGVWTPVALGVNQVVQDGAVVHRSVRKVQVEARGTIHIGVRGGRKRWTYAAVEHGRKILDYVMDLLTTLDPTATPAHHRAPSSDEAAQEP